MNHRYFTKQELYELRNFVPLELVIRKLEIPCKEREGFLRFICPLCHEFNTAINPETNLGRCFRCAQNFNTIEIVMHTSGFYFVKSANYVQGIKEGLVNNRDLNKPKNEGSCGPVSIKEMIQKALIVIQNGETSL